MNEDKGKDDKKNDSFEIIVDQKPHKWHEPFITGLQIKKLAGVDPAAYDAWQDVRGPEDVLLSDDTKVDLRKPGVERFFTGKKTTTEGLVLQTFLPEADREYFAAKELAIEEVDKEGKKAVIVKAWPLPVGRFDVNLVDVLILLPSGYPDIAPDMFYLSPWVRLMPGQTLPKAADQPLEFAGQRWQRWSRHNTEWRSGIDGMWTMLKRVEHALEIAT
ncbi:MAG: multiubiquitin domain-containing protein [Nitrospira sp.]|nr:multiubiquitin domain-containing protein [Nitrospira sp.]